MVKIEFTEKEIKELNYERYRYSHPRVQRKMEALWLKSQGELHRKIARLTGVSVNAVTRYIKEYKKGGIEKLKELNFYRPQSAFVEYQQTIEDYFRKHPPATVKEAMNVLENLTGIKRTEKSVWKFLKRIGLQYRKVGMIPSKANIEEQENFKKKFRTTTTRSQRRKKNCIFY